MSSVGTEVFGTHTETNLS